MNNNRQIWTTEIMLNGVHKVVLEPRLGAVIWLCTLACISWLLFAYCFVYNLQISNFNVGVSFIMLLLFLFGGLSLVVAIHEARRKNYFFISANLMVLETRFFNFQCHWRKSYKNARLKVVFDNMGEAPDIRLVMIHNEGCKVIYIPDYAGDLNTSLRMVCDLGQYISKVTEWPLDLPK